MTDNTTTDDAQEFARLEALAAEIDGADNYSVTTEYDDAPSDAQLSELLTPAIRLTADIFAPNWALADEECEQLGKAYGAVIDKYLPDNDLSKYSIEITAVMTTLIVFGSRAGKPRKAPPEIKKTAKNDDVPTVKAVLPSDEGANNDKD
jgi:hypothetical protein